MKKIMLSNDEHALLRQVRVASVEFKVLRKIFKHYIEDLKDVTNIDLKGNVGLQTCSRAEAYKTLLEIWETFSGNAENETKEIPPESIQKSQWR